LLRRSLLTLLFVTALALSGAPERLAPPTPEPTAAAEVPRPAPAPRSAAPIRPPELEPRRAVARAMPLTPPAPTTRDLWAPPTGAAAVPPVDGRPSAWTRYLDVDVQPVPVSAAAPVPRGSERTRGDVTVAVPLNSLVALRAGLRLDVDDRPGSIDLDGAPTLGLEVRF
jgi:hypothetical protein